MEKEKNLLKIAMIPIFALSLNGCSNKKTDFPPLEEVIFTAKDFDGSTLLFKKFANGGASFYRDKDNDEYIDSFGMFPSYTKPSIFRREVEEWKVANLDGRIRILDLKKSFENQYKSINHLQ